MRDHQFEIKVSNYRKGEVTLLPVARSFAILLSIFLTAGGFFFAGLQHFKTIDLGFRNSDLKKQVQDLEAEKRRLVLAREQALSPAEISRAARRLGFREAEPLIDVSAGNGDAEKTGKILARDNKGKADNGMVVQQARKNDVAGEQRFRSIPVTSVMMNETSIRSRDKKLPGARTKEPEKSPLPVRSETEHDDRKFASPTIPASFRSGFARFR